jgi:hypothetical protein
MRERPIRKEKEKEKDGKERERMFWKLSPKHGSGIASVKEVYGS